MTAKEYFVLRAFEEAQRTCQSKTLRILDMGCGTSAAFVGLLAEYPDIEYVGIEPSQASAAKASQLLAPFPNARVHHQVGYEGPPDTASGSFDLVLSLSVLEHVKQLSRFIETSVRQAKPGALIVHRWDLGHALYPGSLKERFQIFLGNQFPNVLPEHKFVRYVGQDEVQQLLRGAGAEGEMQATRHQMPDHKRFEKVAIHLDIAPFAEQLHVWEFAVSPQTEHIPLAERDMLFPSVAVWVRV